MSTSFDLMDFAYDQDSHLGSNDFLLTDDTERIKNPLMQYTGLKDKNGKEIWEGDILRSPGAKKGFDVYFYDGCFVGRASTKSSWIDIRIFDCQKKGITIWENIGNIYENQKLLEKTNE